MKKKILLSLGTISAVAAPTIAVVACGNNSSSVTSVTGTFRKTPEKVKETIKKIPTLMEEILKYANNGLLNMTDKNVRDLITSAKSGDLNKAVKEFNTEGAAVLKTLDIDKLASLYNKLINEGFKNITDEEFFESSKLIEAFGYSHEDAENIKTLLPFFREATKTTIGKGIETVLKVTPQKNQLPGVAKTKKILSVLKDTFKWPVPAKVNVEGVGEKDVDVLISEGLTGLNGHPTYLAPLYPIYNYGLNNNKISSNVIVDNKMPIHDVDAAVEDDVFGNDFLSDFGTDEFDPFEEFEVADKTTDYTANALKEYLDWIIEQLPLAKTAFPVPTNAMSLLRKFKKHITVDHIKVMLDIFDKGIKAANEDNKVEKLFDHVASLSIVYMARNMGLVDTTKEISETTKSLVKGIAMASKGIIFGSKKQTT